MWQIPGGYKLDRSADCARKVGGHIGRHIDDSCCMDYVARFERDRRYDMTYPHQSCAAGSIRYVQNRIVEIVVHTDLPGQVEAIAGFSRKYVVRDIGAVGQHSGEYCTEEIHGNIVPNMRNLFKRQRKSIHTPVRVCII